MARRKKEQSTDLEAVAAQEHAEAVAGLDVIRNVTISTNEDLELVVETIADAKERRKKVETIRKSFLEPLNEAVARINGFFKPILATYDQAEKILKEEIARYQAFRDEERDRLLQEAEMQAQDGDPVATRVVIEEAEAVVPSKVVGLSQRTQWTGEVVDVSKIPREYMIPDLVKLRAVTAATKGDPKIPGWKAYPKSVLAVKTAGGS